MQKNALHEMIAEEFGEVMVPTSITTSGKSAKILNGINQYSLRAYAGQKMNEDIPDIFQALSSNKNMTTKVQALEDQLNKAQSVNAMVRFTLQQELVKEFVQHAFFSDLPFFSDLLENNMMHGFALFCIQCMDKKSKYNLISLEK